MHRHQGVRGRHPAVAASCARPTATPSCIPAISYPDLRDGRHARRLPGRARCRYDADWTIDLDGIDPADADRALCLWVNTPGQPRRRPRRPRRRRRLGPGPRRAGVLRRVLRRLHLGRPPRTILQHGTEGVVAVHSLSKRSNLAGARVGFYAGDADLVDYLREVRKHAGFMVPCPVQAAAVAALGDEDHVDDQRARYLDRLRPAARRPSPRRSASTSNCPGGAFYLWIPAPDGDAWALTERLADAAAPSCRRASSTARPAPATSGWRRCSPTTASTLVADRLRAAG